MYCKDCVYWESHTDVYLKSWNTCEAANWTMCHEEISEDGIYVYADASDDSGLEAGLMTGPLFGCIKFIRR